MDGLRRAEPTNGTHQQRYIGHFGLARFDETSITRRTGTLRIDIPVVCFHTLLLFADFVNSNKLPHSFLCLRFTLRRSLASFLLGDPRQRNAFAFFLDFTNFRNNLRRAMRTMLFVLGFLSFFRRLRWSGRWLLLLPLFTFSSTREDLRKLVVVLLFPPLGPRKTLACFGNEVVLLRLLARASEFDRDDSLLTRSFPDQRSLLDVERRRGNVGIDGNGFRIDERNHGASVFFLFSFSLVDGWDVRVGYRECFVEL